MLDGESLQRLQQRLAREGQITRPVCVCQISDNTFTLDAMILFRSNGCSHLPSFDASLFVTTHYDAARQPPISHQPPISGLGAPLSACRSCVPRTRTTHCVRQNSRQQLCRQRYQCCLLCGHPSAREKSAFATCLTCNDFRDNATLANCQLPTLSIRHRQASGRSSDDDKN